MTHIIFIATGATLGALARWQLGLWLNPLSQAVSFGTLLANWLGCLLIGIALGLHLQDSAKVFFITGFLGSFTTFSAFSAEVVQSLLTQKWLAAMGIVCLHLLGGLAATLLGFWLVSYFTSGRFG
ncbi:chromosome condensation protein CrcB [Muribacter muris]|uniref:Fluoride-specific ion channel FluC n=1 Tax=Muribacter muris TaxID=67855 RepID=A0A4Y9K6R1_9PAST|nr:CrcB family protein [Muribacter muris]MBF0784140.1 CrcB family protein [Muribacter muris]MBF0827635.1 CrcB family protein [Muribacter muris]TFV13192.1 chromosome condensation protein CrcB [Muribacter muris]